MKKCSQHGTVLKVTTLHGFTFLRCPVPECFYIKPLKLYSEGQRIHGNKKSTASPMPHESVPSNSEDSRRKGK